MCLNKASTMTLNVLKVWVLYKCYHAIIVTLRRQISGSQQGQQLGRVAGQQQLLGCSQGRPQQGPGSPHQAQRQGHPARLYSGDEPEALAQGCHSTSIACNWKIILIIYFKSDVHATVLLLGACMAMVPVV